MRQPRGVFYHRREKSFTDTRIRPATRNATCRVSRKQNNKKADSECIRIRLRIYYEIKK